MTCDSSAYSVYISAIAVQSNAVSSPFVSPVCAPFCKLYVTTVYSLYFSKIIFNLSVCFVLFLKNGFENAVSEHFFKVGI